MSIRHNTTAPRSALWNNDHVGNLDDLDDVNAPSPNAGDIVTWDDSPGEWIAAPPGAVSLDFDDLGDVNIPAPTDGQVPVWDSTPGEWVAGDHGSLAGLSDDDHPQYTTEAEVIALLTPTWYFCDSATVAAGTLATGTHTDLHALGGTAYHIDEAASTPGIQVTLAFSGIDTFNTWMFHGAYNGNHSVAIQLYNYDTASWVTQDTIFDTNLVPEAHSGTLADGDPYVDGSGNAQMRFYHAANGSTSHDFEVDLAMIGRVSGSIPILDHSQLSGLLDDDHTQYVKDAEFLAVGDFIIGTGVGTFEARALVDADIPNGLFVDLSVSGATNIDHDDGPTQDLTLTGDATFTMTNAVTGQATDWRLIMRQDGTGGWTAAWTDTITWVGGTEPVLQTAPNAVDVIGILTIDDGATFFGFHVAGGTVVAALDDLTDVNAPAPNNLDVLTWDSTPGEWIASPATGSVTLAQLTALGLVGTIVMSEGILDPPEPVWNEAGTDYIYAEVGQ